MEFTEVKDEVKKIPFDTLRMDCDNLLEAVVVKEEVKKLTVSLEKFFGQPAWPSKNRMSLQMRKALDSYGGIMVGQTLYYWTKGPETMIAMLWPWQDGSHTTLKLVKR
ncbi:MAG: hypothetical protein NTY47_08635 [Candidatus Omnitrophica bacterium]|nr:hypothetical protein [Candidatus Omnitrophota bacterium]